MAPGIIWSLAPYCGGGVPGASTGWNCPADEAEAVGWVPPR